MEELRRSNTLAESHAESFQKGTETLLEWAKTEQQKSSVQQNGTNKDRDQFRIKWQSAASELKMCQQSRDELQTERDSLLIQVEGLQGKLDKGGGFETSS